MIHIEGYGPEDKDINWKLLKEGSKAEKKKEGDILQIRYDYIENFILGCTFPEENAVSTCKEFFNLPNYIEMKTLIETQSN